MVAYVFVLFCFFCWLGSCGFGLLFWGLQAFVWRRGAFGGLFWPGGVGVGFGAGSFRRR